MFFLSIVQATPRRVSLLIARSRVRVRITQKSTHAYLEGDDLVLEDFRERDSDVLTFVGAADDMELAVHRCLAMGARVLQTAGATLDSEVVEHRFSEMTSQLDRKILEFAERVDQSAKALLDEEQGRLTLALRAWLLEVTQVLGETFDETSKKSAIAKLEKVLEDARGQQVHAVRQLLDPEQDGSPLASWRSDIVREVKEQGTVMGGALRELKQQLAVEAAEAEVFDSTSGPKGLRFEEIVLSQLEPIATAHEDVPEHVGAILGSGGTKVGDIVVAIDPASTPGRSLRYVVEAKDTHLPLKRALDELAKAMINREAQAGLMVFAAQGLSPVKEPFQWFDHRAVVVLDKSHLDAHALRLACLWARWTACREVPAGREAIDPARVHALVDTARRALRTASTIQGSHTKAKAAIDQATGQLGALVEDLKVTLDELEDELRNPGEPDGDRTRPRPQ